MRAIAIHERARGGRHLSFRAMALAHTKTRAPRPREGLLLARPALLDAVRRALDEQRVLLLWAPAG